MGIKLLGAVIAIIAGVGGITLLYFLLNALVERLPGPWENRIKPYIFIAPAVLVVGLFLVYPAVQTVVYSFANDESTRFIGFGNYVDLFGDAGFRSALLNNVLWIVIVPTLSVVVGLVVAIFADRLGPRAESFSKSLIFLPMAISFVGAGTIWDFVYDANLTGSQQIGLLNAVVTAFGGEPVVWLQQSQFSINDFLLMNIMVWLQAGFAMVLLSAAIKNVPDDTIEAARIDGANEVKIFFQVVVPQIWPTMIVVFTTILILVMKIFDIVYVLTNGRSDTEVIANLFFKQLFEFGNNGTAAAVVVVLMLAVIPLMIYQVRQFRLEEQGR
ncbi:sugar ABC transporter permease [Desertihabitans brevis]|uniref:Sugar ABC transporter permease n=1 Tax=Desertihabitans brevis TaxID=2268447 RepID=A0A367YTK3_9ACTN|nr:sugar ABC transporter permease [Desertihabitans brevis]RCK69087.1 sugar ABC transporter permease [Desertihabitans brevis]